MKARKLAAVGAVVLLAVAVSGCSMFSSAEKATAGTVGRFMPTSDLHVHAVPSMKQVMMARVAVMPMIAAPGIGGGDEIEPGAAEAVTAELYSEVATMGGWQVVPLERSEAAMAKFPPTTERTLDQNAIRLGHDLSVDGVLYGMVERYQERKGLDYAAARPASVVFQLKLVDMKTGQVVWTATFARSQKALSQNIFNLANFVYHKARWVRANEIAMDGIRQAINDLHGRLNFQAALMETENRTQSNSGSAAAAGSSSAK